MPVLNLSFMETMFKLFDPQARTIDKLMDVSGNYFVVLRKGCQLPHIDVIPIYTQWKYEGELYDIVYTGINLRKRDYAQDFKRNNAGRSTLRKSLGSMMGLTKVPRDKKNPSNGKTKFCDWDEELLSQWMKENLLLFYCTCMSDEEIVRNKKVYIRLYNPPLNLKGNTNKINRAFRAKLTELRRYSGEIIQKF